MNEKSRLTRCEMLAVSPVRRLSTPITVKPRSRSVSDRCDPMKPAAPVMTTRFLVGMLVEEPLQQREPHDLEIETDRPVLDVVEVVLDAFFDRRIAAPAMHLRPAGDARLHFVPEHVLWNLVLELRNEQRALGPRSDDRHVALEHVPELRQLVDVRSAEQLAERRAPRILLAREHRSGFGFGIVVHRTEFVDHE